MTTPTTTVVCHVRAPLLLEPVDRQIETLQACESEGTIDELLLRSWPKEIALTDESPYQEALESFERFERWADEHGVSIRPPFRKRSTTSQISGETRTLLVMPLACLEVYADDELVGVFPHSDDGSEETYTTDEAIAALRTGALPTPLGGAGETGVSAVVDADVNGSASANANADTNGNANANANSSDCPDCNRSLIDGQGLFACPDCGWVGTVSETGQYVARTDRSTAETTTSPVVRTR
ncbi:hypothetical protein GS429_20455 [Natronorubrum sp. JWXQ-INN-674]|uniref:Uncharacterized protein n=1 Tax=Natronorubrum halalkaliphilum TaxID=2691917 RepID=A0A6B0VSN3_9EURY|nr:HTH domain-containing protein [Natronorubrum halalkaliphilum]MXV64395.1 hypothetical protein [Natronorubrum halalkaliphilum]